MAITRSTRTVPVINGGGSVHVNYTVSDVRSVTVNGQRCEPDADGDISIIVPEPVEVDMELDPGSDNPLSNVGVWAAVNDEKEARQQADGNLQARIAIEAVAREQGDQGLQQSIGTVRTDITNLQRDKLNVSDVLDDVNFTADDRRRPPSQHSCNMLLAAVRGATELLTGRCDAIEASTQYVTRAQYEALVPSDNTTYFIYEDDENENE